MHAGTYSKYRNQSNAVGKHYSFTESLLILHMRNQCIPGDEATVESISYLVEREQKNRALVVSMHAWFFLEMSLFDQWS